MTPPTYHNPLFPHKGCTTNLQSLLIKKQGVYSGKNPKLFFVLFCLIFIFTLFYFTILYWFCHTLTWIHHGCTCDPKHEPSSHLPPHNIPLGHPRAPAPSMLYPALDIDWWFDSYMIVYMFQCISSFSPFPSSIFLMERYFTCNIILALYLVFLFPFLPAFQSFSMP